MIIEIHATNMSWHDIINSVLDKTLEVFNIKYPNVIVSVEYDHEPSYLNILIDTDPNKQINVLSNNGFEEYEITEFYESYLEELIKRINANNITSNNYKSTLNIFKK